MKRTEIVRKIASFAGLREMISGGVRRIKSAKESSESPHLRTGRLGEDQAEKFLKKAGLKIIARNVQVGYDELDLIAQQGETLVFVEVKTRANEDFGRPAAAVNRAKRRKLSRAAIHFLKKRKIRPPYVRFDVIEVIGEKPEIRHIENAFTLEGGYRVWW